MNELIARLAEQAAQEATHNDMVLEVSSDDKSYNVPAGFIEAFAKLIIAECYDIAYDGDGILEHFGVE